MNRKYVLVRIVLPLLWIWSSVAGADATENRTGLRVVTSGGFAAAYDKLAPQFEREYGIELHTERGSSSGGGRQSIPSRLERGEVFDVVILSRSSLDKLIEEGYVVPQSRRDLVHSIIGMAVREGAVIPDISTPQQFMAVLCAADSFAYSASASGTYLSTDLLPRLGVWDELKEKGQRIVGDRVAAVVARGDAEIGFQQVSEILPIKGATFVGPIPDEYQKVTVFAAGITTAGKNRESAETLLEFLSSMRVAEAIESTGLKAVVRLE